MNRFMADVEEPVRTILPQLTRTVQAADELMAVVGGPARRIAPNLVQIVDTLGSPAFTTLPTQLERVHEGDGRRQPAPRPAGAVRRVGGRHVRVPHARDVASGTTRPRTHSPATGGTASTGTDACGEARHDADLDDEDDDEEGRREEIAAKKSAAKKSAVKKSAAKKR